MAADLADRSPEAVAEALLSESDRRMGTEITAVLPIRQEHRNAILAPGGPYLFHQHHLPHRDSLWGPDNVGIGTQLLKLHRPSTLSIERETTRPMTFWHADEPKREGNLLRWDDGTTLTITKGTIDSIDPDGYEDRKSHYGA